MAALPDVNVLVALAWPNHVHHLPAQQWFAAHHRQGWATCPLTESGFVRVSSNPRTTPEAKTPREALAILRRIVAMPGHEFWRDDTSLATGNSLAEERLLGHKQVTDAHLLSLVIGRGGRLVTFDRGVRELVPDEHRHECCPRVSRPLCPGLFGSPSATRNQYRVFSVQGLLGYLKRVFAPGQNTR